MSMSLVRDECLAPKPGPTVPAGGWPDGRRRVPVGISARHVHLSTDDVEALFGPGYRLRVRKWLSQPGQFAAEEVVALVGPRGRLERVRVLGPVRGATQVELAYTDARIVGLRPPVRLSGDHRDTPGIQIEGPRGRIEIPRGVIIAARHVHMHPEDATRLGLVDGQVVRARVRGARGVVFEQVVIRVHPSFRLEMHVDTDEGNAAGLEDGDWAELEV